MLCFKLCLTTRGNISWSGTVGDHIIDVSDICKELKWTWFVFELSVACFCTSWTTRQPWDSDGWVFEKLVDSTMMPPGSQAVVWTSVRLLVCPQSQIRLCSSTCLLQWFCVEIKGVLLQNKGCWCVQKSVCSIAQLVLQNSQAHLVSLNHHLRSVTSNIYRFARVPNLCAWETAPPAHISWSHAAV